MQSVLGAILRRSGVAIALIFASLYSCNPSSPNSVQGDSIPEATEPSVSSVPPPPPADAFLGKVSPSVFAKISHLPVMAPSYVPSGFVLTDYHSTGEQSYDLIYRDPKNQCFAIEYRRQLPPAESRDGFAVKTFDSPVFGPDRELYYSTSSSSPSEEDTPSQLLSQWLSKDTGSYRLAGADAIAQNYPAQTPCQNVSLEEASQIITSIADLTASPTE